VFHFFSQDDFSAIPVRQASVASDEDWDRTLDDELHDVIDPARALWRLTCVTGLRDGQCGILVSYHHAIMDGAAVHGVLDDLLDTVDRLMSGEAVLLESESMPKGVDDYLLPASAGSRSGSRSGEPIDHVHAVPIEERRTRYLRTTIPSAQNLAFKARCSEDRIQPNSLISAALSLAMVQAGIARSPVPFKSAVSLRNLPGCSQTVMGCYLAVADTPLAIVEDESLPELARRYERSLMDAVTRHCIRAGAFNVSAVRQYVQRVHGGNRFDAFGVTNLGEIDLQRGYRHFTVSDYIPLANRVAGNQALVLHVSEFRGALDLFFVYPEPAMSRNGIHLVQSMFESFLTGYMNAQQGKTLAAAG
jgi:hypothetical protein